MHALKMYCIMRAGVRAIPTHGETVATEGSQSSLMYLHFSVLASMCMGECLALFEWRCDKVTVRNPPAKVMYFRTPPLKTA